MECSKNYYINNPIFVKYKKKFAFHRLRWNEYLKTAFVNERIVETPFVINALASISFNSKILDLGCMESALPIHLATLGYQVTGFDFRSYPYRHPNFNFVKGNILELPFEDDYFEVVTCISTLEHVGIGYYNDPLLEKEADIKAMRGIRRVLKNNGMLILSVPFGVARLTPQYKIYDSESLNLILRGFEIKTKRFFANTRYVEEQANYWKEIKEEDGVKISSDSASCVCLVNAKLLQK